MLVLLNVPLIGIWVKLLAIPYKYLYPSALFFVCIGVYSANNDFFQVGEVAGHRHLRLLSCCGSASTRRRSCSASCSARGSRRTSAAPC